MSHASGRPSHVLAALEVIVLMMTTIMMMIGPEKSLGSRESKMVSAFRSCLFIMELETAPFPTWDRVFVEPKFAFGFYFRINMLF